MAIIIMKLTLVSLTKVSDGIVDEEEDETEEVTVEDAKVGSGERVNDLFDDDGS